MKMDQVIWLACQDLINLAALEIGMAGLLRDERRQPAITADQTMPLHMRVLLEFDLRFGRMLHVVGIDAVDHIHSMPLVALGVS